MASGKLIKRTLTSIKRRIRRLPSAKAVRWFDSRWYFVDVNTKQVVKVPDAWKGRRIEAVPAVHNILGITDKPYFDRRRGELGNREFDRIITEAQEKGTAVHKACHAITQRRHVLFQPPWNPPMHTARELRKIKPAVTLSDQDAYLQIFKWKRWTEAVQMNVLMMEQPVASLKLGYGGTMDYLSVIPFGEYLVGPETLKLERGIYIIDIKSGKFIDDDAFVQMGSYYKLAVVELEIDPRLLKGALVVHLNSGTRKGLEGVKTYFRTAEELVADYQAFEQAKALWHRKFEGTKPTPMDLPSYI